MPHCWKYHVAAHLFVNFYYFSALHTISLDQKDPIFSMLHGHHKSIVWYVYIIWASTRDFGAYCKCAKTSLQPPTLSSKTKGQNLSLII